MLAAFRRFAQSTAAKVFLTLLGLSFLAWGAGSRLTPNLSTAVITAGSREVSPEQFKEYFDRDLRQIEHDHPGQTVTTEEAVDQGLDQQVLKAVSAHEAFGEFMHRIGLIPSPRLIAADIRGIPAFLDPLGDFDKQTYERELQQNHMTDDQFESEVTDEMAENHLQAGMAAGLVAPNTYAAVLASYQFENRTFTYFVVDPRVMPPPPAPTDAQILAFYNQNAAQLTRPEMRALTVVSLDPQALAATLPENVAEEQKLYQTMLNTPEQRDRISTPEKRSFEELATRDAGVAQKIAAALKAGTSPDAVAKTFGAKPQSYADAPKTAVADPAVADAAFGGTAGQVIGPVSSGLEGYVVVKLDKVTPGAIQSFDALKAQLAAQAKTDDAKLKVYAAYQKYEDAHDGGSNLADSAKAAGVTPVQVGPITAQGQGPNGQPVPGVSPQLLHEAFSLPQGAESDMEDLGGGSYVAVRVEKIIPSAPPPLAEIKPQLTIYMQRQTIVTNMQAKADALAAAIRKGQPMAAAAASVQSQPKQIANFPRAALGQNRAISAQLGAALFNAKTGDVITGEVAGQGGAPDVMVAHIDAANSAPPMIVAQQAVGAREAEASQIFQDIMGAVNNAAVAKIKPKVDDARAQESLGITARSAAKPASSSHGPAL
jgi:peptidyl-prolyl cis-trans isomerase D